MFEEVRGSFEALRLHLSPWAYASLPLANHSASSLPPWFSSPSVSVNFLFSVAGDLERSLTRLCGSTVADSSSPHLEWPVPGSAALREKVQQVGAAVHVEVLAHAIWTFVVFWSDLVAQLTTMVRLMVMRDSQLWDPHPPWVEFVVPVALVALVALVREDVRDLDRCRCLPSCVVADHLRHHSLELVSVEAPVMEIAVVIAHAMHFRLLLFLSHQQVEELAAILVEVQAV